MPLTDEHLAEIEARLRQITPTPWEECWVADGPDDPGVSAITAFRNDLEFVVVQAPGEDDQSPQESMDIEFIAHAPEDIAALLAEVRRLREIESVARERAEYKTGARNIHITDVQLRRVLGLRND